MDKNFNSQTFTPEEIKQGLQQDLLNYLFSFNQKSKESFYDIHISSDGYCSTVEWVEKHFKDESIWEDGSFKYVPYYAEIVEEYEFPDGHCEYFTCNTYEEDTQKALNKWLSENPGWEKNSLGRWTITHKAEKEK